MTWELIKILFRTKLVGDILNILINDKPFVNSSNALTKECSICTILILFIQYLKMLIKYEILTWIKYHEKRIVYRYITVTYAMTIGTSSMLKVSEVHVIVPKINAMVINTTKHPNPRNKYGFNFFFISSLEVCLS